MTVSERAEKAVFLKHSGHNCAQSVVLAFREELGLSGETIKILTSGYATGMGCMEATCGALVGAVMVAGWLVQGRGAPKVAKAILERFKELCGATICRDLKGVDTGRVLCSCDDCVRNAVRAVHEILIDK